MRIMGIDFGTKRIGIALSDELMLMAHGLTVIQSKGVPNDIESIKKLAAENGVSEIVVGLPISMNGTHSAKTKETIDFVSRLAKEVLVPVNTWDERLTSVQAERIMLESDISRAKRRKASDKIAAQLILQGYLDAGKKRIKDV